MNYDSVKILSVKKSFHLCRKNYQFLNHKKQ